MEPMKFWLGAFVLGLVAAKQLGSSALLVGFDLGILLGALLALGVCTAWRRFPRRGLHLGLAGLGFLWGLAHAAPALERSLAQVEVVKTNGMRFAKGTVIVSGGERTFEAYGPQRVGYRARAMSLPSWGVFSRRRAFLVAPRASAWPAAPADPAGLGERVRRL